MNGIDGAYAVNTIRDQFLNALDNRDRDRVARLALQLTSCGNPLPSATCLQLGLPVGSTYGNAARWIIAHDLPAASGR